MLRLDHLTYAHPGQASGYSFTLEAKAGEVTAVSGPSGSGKSTLLDLIAGFLTPTGGTLTLDGTSLIPQSPEQRPVSILFQSDALFEHLTAGRNIALGLPATTAKATRQERVAAALAEVGLPDVAEQRAETLSGGEKQRVALARTLLRNRPVLLLDEPFSALDDATRTSARDLVRWLTKEHQWITILVSHYADDVEALASKRYAIVDRQLEHSAQ